MSVLPQRVGPARRRPAVPQVRRRPAVSLGRWAVIGAWGAFVLVPLVVLVAQSVSDAASPGNALGLGERLDFSNYAGAWRAGRLGSALAGSLFVTVVAVTALVVLGSLAAYPLARRRGWVYTLIFNCLVGSFVLPPALSVVPLYREMAHLSLLNSHWSLILIYIGQFFALSVFLYTGFIRSIPFELEEAACVDGADAFRTYRYIVLPLLKPITATVIILCSLPIWTDFFYPLLFLQSGRRQTAALAIYSFYTNGGASTTATFATPWPRLFAGVVMTTLPIALVFFALQRYFVSGIVRGALKG